MLVNIMRSARPARTSPGFTLIELIITMAIFAIGLAIAVPSYRDFIAATRVKNAAFDLSAMLTLARSEAIKRNANAALVLDASGWAVATPDAAGTIIQRREAFNGVTTACKTAAGCPAAWPTNGIVYAASGRLTTNPAPAIDITGEGTTTRRCISLELSGLPKSSAVTCP